MAAARSARADYKMPGNRERVAEARRQLEWTRAVNGRKLIEIRPTKTKCVEWVERDYKKSSETTKSRPRFQKSSRVKMIEAIREQKQSRRAEWIEMIQRRVKKGKMSQRRVKNGEKSDRNGWKELKLTANNGKNEEEQWKYRRKIWTDEEKMSQTMWFDQNERHVWYAATKYSASRMEISNFFVRLNHTDGARQ